MARWVAALSLVLLAGLGAPEPASAGVTVTGGSAGSPDIVTTWDGAGGGYTASVTAGYCFCLASPWPGEDTNLFTAPIPSDIPESQRNGSPVSENCNTFGQQIQCRVIDSFTATGSPSADNLTANSGEGSTLDVEIDAGGGDDTVRLAGYGQRSADGQGGEDTFTPYITQAGAGVEPKISWVIDLQAGTATGNNISPVTLQNFENASVRPFGTFDSAIPQTVRGDDAANDLAGDTSPDTLVGRGGADDLVGDSGDDVLTGGAGDDRFDCGPGDDTVTDAEPGEELIACEHTDSGLVVNDSGDAGDFDLEDEACDIDDEEPGSQCTLRAAIQEANAVDGAEEIEFDIEPGGVVTIELGANLPPVKEQVSILGGTQPGAPVGEPGVFIDGAGISAKRRGIGGPGRMMTFNSGSGSLLESLGFVNGLSTAIGVQIDAQLTTIDGVFVGLSQMYSAAGLEPNGLDGIQVEGVGTLIRDSVISGNGRYGVLFTGSSRLSRLISSTVGPFGPPAGLPPAVGPVTNQTAGVAISDGAKQNVIGGAAPGEGNAIGRNGTGILLDDAGASNQIISNEIGATHDDGAALELLANEGAGIEVDDTRLKVSQETEVTTNTIANNAGDGIAMTDSGGVEVTGNAIGALMTDTGCTHVLIGNELRQVDVETAKKYLRKQGAGDGKRAAIGSGGLRLGGSAGLLEALGGNLICDEDGVAIGFSGVIGRLIVESTVIEGGGLMENLTGAFAEATISSSDGAGLELGKGTEVELARNTFLGNFGRPIFFDKGSAQFPPDPLDSDKGPNGLQNFPYLGFFEAGPGGSQSRFSLMAAKRGKFRIEFFGADSCQPDGQAEVQAFIGSRTVETSAAGLGDEVASLPAGAQGFAYVTATATRLDVSDPLTSEISPCVPVVQEGDTGFGLVPTDLYAKKGKVATVADCLGLADCTGEARIVDPGDDSVHGTAAIDIGAGDSDKLKIKLDAETRRELDRKGKAAVILRSITDETRETPLLLRDKG